jgi:hypothetical protein
MGLHTWNDTCTCGCGATRDSNHKWDGYTCTFCHTIRSTNHHWNDCTCTTSGKVRSTDHDLVNCVRTVCGKDNHFWKVLDISTEYRPGKTRSGEIKDMVFTTTLSKCDRCGNLKTDKTKSEAVNVAFQATDAFS